MKFQWIIILVLSGFTVLAQPSTSSKELEKQRKTLLNEIENTNKLLKENQQSIGNVQQSLKLVIQQINTREQLVNTLEKEINTLDKEIQDKENLIIRLEQNLRLKKKHYTIAIQKMYQQKNNQDQLFFVLSANNIAQSFRRALYLKKYSNWRKAQGEEIIAQKKKITLERQNLQENVYKKTNLVNIKKDEEQKLYVQQNAKKTEINGLKNNTNKLQAEIAKKKRQAEVLNREIKKTIQREIAEAKKAIQAKPKIQRKAETTDGYAMTKEEQVLSANFANNKGKLPFPLKGNYCIVSHFGQQQYGAMENIHYNNNGIDIKTTQNNIAKTVFDGVITRIFVVPGYQTSVIIRHGNYLTLYSYIEQVSVQQGEKVKTGQNIGRIYTDKENGNSTILHFELWKEQSKLNPESWLYR